MSTSNEIDFLWTDLETSGLDEKNDRILEIAWAITDNEFNLRFEPKRHVIAQEDWLEFFQYWNESVSPVVKRMHDDNGLFEEIQQEGVSNLDRAYISLEQDLLAVPKNHEVHMAGRSVHFDRSFLLNNEFTSLFQARRGDAPLISHRVFDVRTLKTFFGLMDLEIPEPKLEIEHRALSDVLGDIEYAKNARAMLGTAFPHPPVMVSTTPFEDYGL